MPTLRWCSSAPASPVRRSVPSGAVAIVTAEAGATVSMTVIRPFPALPTKRAAKRTLEASSAPSRTVTLEEVAPPSSSASEGTTTRAT